MAGSMCLKATLILLVVYFTNNPTFDMLSITFHASSNQIENWKVKNVRSKGNDNEMFQISDCKEQLIVDITSKSM